MIYFCRYTPFCLIATQVRSSSNVEKKSEEKKEGGMLYFSSNFFWLEPSVYDFK